MRSVGTSSSARSRYSASVAASAASVSLSGRSARISGCLRARLDRRLRADDDAGLRAAEQLVAGERHEVGAGRDGLGDRRLVGQPPRALGRAVDERARAEIDHRRRRRGARPSATSSSAATSLVNPTIAKFERWTLSSSPVCGPIAAS